MQFQLRVTLPCETPVLGCEIVPNVFLRCHGKDKVPDHSLHFCWYRSESDYKVLTCCIHPSKLATFQCMCCVTLNIPLKDSYHCSGKCFTDSWHHHRTRHSEAAVKLQKTNLVNQEVGELMGYGAWPFTGSWSVCGSREQLINHDLLLNTTEILVEHDGKSWFKVGSANTYAPARDDVDHILRLECFAIDSMTGNPLTTTEVVLTGRVIVPPVPHIRCMIQVGPSERTGNVYLVGTQPSVSGGFSVLSYNILSNIYATGIRYEYCPSWALTWQYRRQNLLREIVGYNADIVCLQEVQSDHFRDFFSPELAKRGYSVIYKAKAVQVYTGKQYVSEGCATFFHHDRFREIRKVEVEYNQYAQKVVDGLHPSEKSSGIARLMKDNIAIIVVLEIKENSPFSDTSQPGNGQLICVANTHIHANASLTDVKLFQVATLLSKLDEVSWKAEIPILICGDLNSLPGSAAYNLVVTGNVNPCHADMALDPFGILKNLSHHLPLVSAYSSLLWTSRSGYCFMHQFEQQKRCTDSRTNEPIFTNFTDKFMGAIDYIFYTAESLILDGLLELLDPESVKKTKLPSPLWSSDHIALMASFRFRPKKRQRLPSVSSPSQISREPWQQ